MDMKEHFRQVFDSLPEMIEKRREKPVYPAMGFSSNLDLILDFHVERLNELLAEHMAGKNLEKMRPAPLIRTVEELLETIVYFCAKGIGGEADIEEPHLIRREFPCTSGIGGTAVQAAMALAQIGAESVVHLTDDSPELCGLLDSPMVHVPSADGSLGSTARVINENPQEVHVILQFQKGQEIRLDQQRIIIPCSNRLILTKNTVNTWLPMRRTYFDWVEAHAEQVSSNVVSSFNCVLEREILEERLDFVRRHLGIYHRRNPGGIVYFEDAHYHDAGIRRQCLEELSPCVDILSMNEEELAYTLKMYDVPVDIDDVLSCVQGVEFLLGKFRVRRGMIVHTKDYAMFVGDRSGIDIERGMIAGVCLATSKAAFGRYGGWNEIREILEYDLSPKGLRNLEILRSSSCGDRVILVPTCYIDKPRFTIGLGDSFTGGVQLCFGI